MIPEWVNIVAPVVAVLLGVVVAGGVNYWFANRREQRHRRQETEGAAVMLLAEVEKINYRLGMAIQDQNPESPKRWKNEVQMAYLKYRPPVLKALNEERSGTHSPDVETRTGEG